MGTKAWERGDRGGAASVGARFKRVWTPAQIAVAVFGLWWALDGIGALASGGTSGSSLEAHGQVSLLGISIAVNGWHGVFHLATGLGGLAVCVRPEASRLYAMAVGLLYLVAACWGLLFSGPVLGFIVADALGSIVHAVEGAVVLCAGLLSPSAASAAAESGAGEHVQV
ncbi:MAG TPA: DUF4383 domain-containing protein [Solirubrobacterales bacterium]|jgi:hypothetical protein|nr:DUF4383 domain-containing protein [Solirubrobacterales bacterium]